MEREKVILAIGKLNRYYYEWFDNLIEIVITILKKNPEWHLKIDGDGKEGKKYWKIKLEKTALKVEKL